MPTDPHAFILEHKDRDIDGQSSHFADSGVVADDPNQPLSSRSVMELNYESDYSWTTSTISSSTSYVALTSRVMIPRSDYDVQVVAGAKSPRAGGRDDSSSAEPWGEEVGPALTIHAKCFVYEAKNAGSLLHRSQTTTANHQSQTPLSSSLTQRHIDAEWTHTRGSCGQERSTYSCSRWGKYHYRYRVSRVLVSA